DTPQQPLRRARRLGGDARRTSRDARRPGGPLQQNARPSGPGGSDPGFVALCFSNTRDRNGGTQRLEPADREHLQGKRRSRAEPAPWGPRATGTLTATPSMPYSPWRTSDAGQTGSSPERMARTIRETPKPVVQVELRPESSATWRMYQLRTNSTAAAAWASVGGRGIPSTRTRSKRGTNASPCSPIAHASTDPGCTPNACARPLRSRRLAL